MTKYRHLTNEQLLYHAEASATHSPLIAELCERLRNPVQGEEVFPLGDVTATECPVCEGKLEINTFADESTPTITKAVL